MSANYLAFVSLLLFFSVSNLWGQELPETDPGYENVPLHIPEHKKSGTNCELNFKNYCPQPPFQGSCNTCAAYGVVSSIRINQNIKEGLTNCNALLLNYSASDLFTRSGGDPNNGVYLSRIINEAQNGLCDGTDFRPTGSSRCIGTCKGQRKPCCLIERLWEDNSKNKINRTIDALQNYSPVIVCFDKTPKDTLNGDDWNPAIESKPKGFDHVMVVVAYQNNRFMLFNSFGPTWGRNGFAWIGETEFERYAKYGYWFPSQNSDRSEIDCVATFEGAMNVYAGKESQLISVTYDTLSGIYQTTNTDWEKDTHFSLELTAPTMSAVYVLSLTSQGQVYDHYKTDFREPTDTTLKISLQDLSFPHEEEYKVVLFCHTPLDSNTLNEYIENDLPRTTGNIYDRLTSVFGNQLISPNFIQYKTSYMAFTSQAPCQSQIVPIVLRLQAN